MPHTTAAILSIGDELTLGQTLDTNSQWLSGELAAVGIDVVEHVTVPDNLVLHVAALTRLSKQVDLIISSGGLGPTADDLTRAAVAAAAGDTLVEDAESLAQIEAFFSSRRRVMPPINRVQALRPSRGSAIGNPNGTAPGLYCKVANADCFCAPGPPGELKPMFTDQILPRLQVRKDVTIRTRVMGTVGLGESDIAMRLGPLMDRDRNPLVGTTASGGIVSCRLRYQGPLDQIAAAALLETTQKEISGKLDPYVFSTTHNSLAAAVVETLIARNLTLCVVESCTGGMLGAALTEVPGSSEAFVGGFLTYSNELKSRLVGVSTSTLSSFGAVSSQTAAAMASGGRAASGADIGVSITGVAGPAGGTPEKPVGTVWISVDMGDNGPDIRRFHIPGTRQAVRSWSVSAALSMLWMGLQGRKDVRLLRQIEPK